MKKNIIICLAILCMFSITASAQLSDLVRFEYVGLPESSTGGTSFGKYRALVNYPVKLKKEGSYLLLGADYSFISFDTDDSLLSFDTEEIRNINQLSLSFGYTYKMNEDWRFGVQVSPGFSTNLRIRDITTDDGVVSANIVFIKNKKKVEAPEKPHQLIVGLRLSGGGGFPILPFISYYRKFHPKWSYNLGIPKTQLQYHLNNNNRIKLVARIDGFRSNLQNDIITEPGAKAAERLLQRLLVTGVRYEHKLSKHIEFYINGSYIIGNTVELRDNDRNTIFEFTDDSIFYLKTGVRFKI